MPWTEREVRFLESSGSPLTSAQKAKMNSELHANPALGHHQKGSSAMKKAPFRRTEIRHHDDGSHTVEHYPHAKPATKSHAFMDHGEPKSYSVEDNKSLMSSLQQHLGGKSAETDAEAAEGAAHEVDA